jgi:hypothetical protein
VRLCAYVALLCAACYPDEDDIERFVGTWLYESDATETSDCNEGGEATSVELSGTFEIVAGAQSDLLTGMATNCPIALMLFDRTAIAKEGQICELGAPVNATVAIEGATYALGPSDGMLTFRTALATTLPSGACRTTSSGSAIRI